jgi:aminoglycoside phosphotransferase family enzyme/predicted kinase
MSEQNAVFALLADPATYGIDGPVRRIETHAAVVFLAGPDAYKIKRAVRFPFLDQSTLALRQRMCEAEVRVNRSFTPALYHGVVPITREADRLRVGGSGEAVEWAVHMRRFDETQTLDLVAARGGLTLALIADVAGVILASHRAAAVGRGVDALAGVVDESLGEIVARPEMFAAGEARQLASAMTASLQAVRDLLKQREAEGRIRRCHGDLHLRNIALLDGRPALFDAIEFDEAIATIDVLYDLAFILMDLWERGLKAEANLLLNRILWACQDLAGELRGLAAMPLYLSLRAAVHAKVDALRFVETGSVQARADALRYFASAREFLVRQAPVLIAIGGLSGSGKTALAARMAHRIGRAPGAVHLRSDIERKRLMGVGEHDRLGADGYREEVTSHVYGALREQAGMALAAGQSVIVDAVHARPAERDQIGAVAKAAGVRFLGLWLDAPLDRLLDRVAARTHDASDATGEIVRRQMQWSTGEIGWRRLDAAVSLEILTTAALAAAL